MTLDTAIGHFRSQEVDLFRSTCTVRRTDGSRIVDTDTGTSTQPTIVVFTGACMVRRTDTDGTDVQVGQGEARLRDLKVKLPADTPVAVDDVITIDTSPDAGLVGSELRITDIVTDDWQINRVCAVEEVTL